MNKLQQIYTALTGYEHLKTYSSAADTITKEYITEGMHSDIEMKEQIVMYAENCLNIQLENKDVAKVLEALKLVKKLKLGDGEQFMKRYEIAYKTLK